METRLVPLQVLAGGSDLLPGLFKLVVQPSYELLRLARTVRDLLDRSELLDPNPITRLVVRL